MQSNVNVVKSFRVVRDVKTVQKRVKHEWERSDNKRSFKE